MLFSLLQTSSHTHLSMFVVVYTEPKPKPHLFNPILFLIFMDIQTRKPNHQMALTLHTKIRSKPNTKRFLRHFQPLHRPSIPLDLVLHFTLGWAGLEPDPELLLTLDCFGSSLKLLHSLFLWA